MILASLALLVLLAAGTAWLVTGDEPTQASTRPPTSQKSAVLKATTTPAPSKPESTPVTTTAADPASTPTAEVAVPGVIGLSASDAAREIRAAGLRSQVRLTTSSRTAGTVIAQSPAEGEAIERDGVVEIDVAKRIARPAAVRVPGLTGSTAADAKNRLRALGLHWSVVDVTSDEPRGMVVGQSPTSGVEVRKGQTVTLRVSSSPAQIAVPDVTGLDAQSARVELEGAGFDVTVVDQPTTDPAEDGTVIGQDPAGGQEAEKGATVTITVARLG